jgi:hypothetical protein
MLVKQYQFLHFTFFLTGTFRAASWIGDDEESSSTMGWLLWTEAAIHGIVVFGLERYPSLFLRPLIRSLLFLRLGIQWMEWQTQPGSHFLLLELVSLYCFLVYVS